MEFLFENPFILIAVIAFISSMFKKKKEERPVKQAPRSVQQENRTQAERTSADPALAEVLEEEKRKLTEKSRRIEQEYRQRKQQTEQSMKALQSQQRAAERKASAISRTAANTKTYPVEASGAGKFEPQKQSLVDGIIWSEILGPPRSKNPHRSLNRKR
ncbi:MULTISPECIES: hypothetical protein [Bacillaceae]|uniref:hypothetical protein n=1 Tax=Bacillaceae TaxID=186817 RepID=UPI000BA7D299|nr:MULTISPECIES: hypothetical protein [Bacillaceae]PAE23308.1 hypothetical protein CHI10_18380 [Bacillus sp. 7894-2]URM34062.1 hypothetical protein LLY41_06495 [Cytobacillus firmus]